MRLPTMIAALMMFAPAATAQSVLRVPEQYGSIQGAMDAASPGDTVLVSPGRYVESLYWTKTLTIRSTSGPWSTIIEHDDPFDQGAWYGPTVINFSAGSTLEGFTVTNGWQHTPLAAGGGVCAVGGYMTIRNCVVADNFGYYMGGGIGFQGGGGLIENCIITDNQAGWGGGVYGKLNPNQTVHIRNTIIYDNLADWDGGAISGGYYDLTKYGTIRVENCTVVGNTSVDETGGGIGDPWFSGVDYQVVNSIIRGNTGGDQILLDAGYSDIVAGYSNIEGGFAGNGIIDADPLFVSLGNHDYRLAAGSPSIDAGDSTAFAGGVFHNDLWGVGRVVNDPASPDTGVPDSLAGVIDMGANEFQPDCDGDGVLDGAAVAEAFPGAGSSLRLDGINDHAIVEGFLDIPIRESMIEFWAYTPLWDIQAPFGFWDCDQPSRRIQVHLPWADGFVYWQHGDTDTQWYASLIHKSTPLPSRQGRWTHWAFVTEPSTNTTKIYHDGKVVEARGGWGTYPGANVPLVIGDRGNPADGCSTAPFRGMIDEFRVWSVARTEAEIAASLAVPLAGDEPGLLAYYTFDEGVGSTSANLCLNVAQPDAELRNGASWHIPSEIDRDQNGIIDDCEDCNNNGRPDGTEFGAFEGTEWAIEFDGDGARADSTQAPDFSIAGQSFTVEAWVFRREATGQEEYFFFHGTEGVANQGMAIGFRADGRFTCAFWANDLETLRPIEPDGQWHHWACTYDAATNARRIYVDGDVIASDTAPADFAGTGTIRVGGFASRAYFNGTLDEIRLWDHARTASEIEADMFRSFTGGPIPPELHAYWPGETPSEGYLLDYAGDNDLLPENGSEWEYFSGSDCNGNGVLDACDPDSDGDGIPDDCDCAADFNNDGDANTLDVLAFLNAWTAGESSADMNGDGTVNTLDVLVFLNLWTAGC